MKKKRSTAGFTMMETMGVVAIIAILGALIFVNVISYQRSLKQLELDGTAKEIFVAAQNHLAMAKSQELVDGRTDPGHEDSSEPGVYYFVYSTDDPDSSDSVFGLMLPFASVDETVRVGSGSYIVRYHKPSGKVLDVFYAETTGQYAHTFTTNYDDVRDLAGKEEEKKQARKDCFGDKHAVVGWYGDVDADTRTPAQLKKPSLKIVNAERLYVEVKDNNADSTVSDLRLQLVITGKNSGAKLAVELSTASASSNSRISRSQGGTGDTYTVILDDVTNKTMHFADLVADSGAFQPGEDIYVNAKADSLASFTDVVYAYKDNDNKGKPVNSLYAKVQTEAAPSPVSMPTSTAHIANIRHLENLDPNVSGLDVSVINITKAEQQNNLVWTDSASTQTIKDDLKVFYSNLKGFREKLIVGDYMAQQGSLANVPAAKEALASQHVKVYERGGAGTNNDTYQPVNLTYALDYDGKKHSITGVVVNNAADAGLFGKTTAATNVKDLELRDFKVTTSNGSAGALVGDAATLTTNNVLTHNTIADDKDLEIVGSKSTGGLVGTMQGGSIKNSAAAVYVKSTGSNAGGLVGEITAASGEITIQGSYSGGHTKEGSYQESADGQGRYNVNGKSSAGGLVGKTGASKVTIAQSYSTSSVYGSASNATVAGLVGSTANLALNKCYAVGRVFSAAGATGVTKGGIVGSATTSPEATSVYWLGSSSGASNPVGNKTDATTGYKAFDDTLLPAVDKRADAIPYDDAVISDSKPEGSDNEGSDKSKFFYLTCAQLFSEIDPKDTTSENSKAAPKVHYGDWEIAVGENNLTIKDVDKEINYLVIDDPDYVVSPNRKKGDSGNVVLTYESIDREGNPISYTRDLIPEKDWEDRTGSLSSTDVKYRYDYKANGYTDSGYETSQWCKAYTDTDGVRHYYVLIDTVTGNVNNKSNGHFSDRFPDFNPAHDVTVTAYVRRGGRLLKGPDSITFNPLFEKAEKKNNGTLTASLANGRHVENLSTIVSNISNLDTGAKISAAEMTSDIVWNDVYDQQGVKEHFYDDDGSELLSFWDNVEACIPEEAENGVGDGHFSFDNWNRGAVQTLCMTEANNPSPAADTDPDRTGTGRVFVPITILESDPSNRTAVTDFVFRGNNHRFINMTVNCNPQVGTAANSVLGATNTTALGFDRAIGGLGFFSGNGPDTNSTYCKLTVRDLFLVNPSVGSDRYDKVDPANGAIIGANRGELIVSGCGVYCSSSDQYYMGAANLTNNNRTMNNTTRGRHVYSKKGSAAGIVGRARNNCTIQDTFASVPVYAGIEGEGVSCGAGGLVGVRFKDCPNLTIENSYTSGYLTPSVINGKFVYQYSPTSVGVYVFSSNANDAGAGGILGYNYERKKLSIQNCYSTASVGSNVRAGGFIGNLKLNTNNDRIQNCYALGTVYGPSGKLQKTSGLFASNNNDDASNEALKNVFVNCHAFGLANSQFAETPEGYAHPQTALGLNESRNDYEIVEYRETEITTDFLIAQRNNDGPTATTAYNVKQDDYPYRVVNGTGVGVEATTGETDSSGAHWAHYGDWPEIHIDLDTDLTIVNADKLTAQVKMPVSQITKNTCVAVLVKGTTSGQERYLAVNLGQQDDGSFSPSWADDSDVKEASWFSDGIVRVVASDNFVTLELNLDDVTKANGHFANLFTGFTPGEDLVIVAENASKKKEDLEAIATDRSKWTATGVSVDTRTIAAETNSLYANGSTSIQALIAYVRHLENLDPLLSGVTQTLTTASITRNIAWSSETYPSIVAYNSLNSVSGGFFGIYNPNLVELTGNHHELSNFNMASTPASLDKGPANAGLFRMVDNGMTIKNVRLSECSARSEGGGAGAIAALVEGSGLTLNTVLVDSRSGAIESSTGTTGDAGGLIGRAAPNTAENVVIQNSAASVVVRANRSAGGLVGTQTSGALSITASYAGGHTDHAAYNTQQGYNVTSASGDAGGLVGRGAGEGLSIQNSFSAVSVSGSASAGGIVGTAQVPLQIDYVYTVAPVGGVVAGEDCQTAGAVCGVAGNVTVGEGGCYYVPEVYPDGAAYDDGTSNVPAAATGASINATAVAYAKRSAISARDAKQSNTVVRYTKPFDAQLSGSEYPFLAWTSFRFATSRAQTSYYGDWQPVDTSARVHKATFYYLDPREEDAAGTECATRQFFHGKTARVLEPVYPSFPHYKFDGWYYRKDGQDTKLEVDGHYVVLDSTITNEDIEIYGKYVLDENSFEVIFEYQSNSGQPVTVKEIVSRGMSATVPNARRVGYTFLGWFEDPVTGEDQYPLASLLSIQQNVHLYARYKEIAFNEITINFVLEKQNNQTEKLAEPYVISIEDGVPFEETFNFPETDRRYDRCVVDNPESINVTTNPDLHTITVASPNGQAGTCTVFFKDEEWRANYTVRYVFNHTLAGEQDPMVWAGFEVPAYHDSQQYVAVRHENGIVGSMANVEILDVEGFTCEQLPGDYIRSDDSTVVTLTYNREQYPITYDLQNGETRPATLLEYGQNLNDSLSTPTNVYGNLTFTGWSFTKEQDGSEYSGATMPAYALKATANWSGQADYTVLYWLQNADDDGITFGGSEKSRGEVGAMSTFTPNANKFTHYHLRAENPVVQSKIRADGTTIVNVYYDREIMTVYFLYPNGVTHPSDAEINYTVTTNNDGDQFGYVDGNYVELQRDLAIEIYEATTLSYAQLNEQYGIDDSEYVELRYNSSSSRWQYYKSSWTGGSWNNYNGKRYAYRGLQQYTGQRYSYDYWSGYYKDANGQYGKDSNGIYLQLSTAWSYNNEQYSGTRYTYSSDYPYRVTWTGRYGESFATHNHEWDSSVDWYEQNSSGGKSTTRMTFRTEFTDKYNPFTYYGQTRGSYAHTMRHYKEHLDGSYGDATGNAADATAGISGNSKFNFSDKFSGFTVCAYATSSNGPKTTVTSGDQLQNINSDVYVYHKRKVFTLRLHYKDGTDWEEVTLTNREKEIKYGTNISERLQSLSSKWPTHRVKGYKVDGWYYEPTLETQVGQTDTVQNLSTGYIDLYAKWEAGLTLDFNLNAAGDSSATMTGEKTRRIYDGPAIDTYTDIIDDGNWTSAYTPTRDGYLFDTWCTDAACTQPVVVNSPIVNNLTLYARWIKATRTVKVHYVCPHLDEQHAMVYQDVLPMLEESKTIRNTYTYTAQREVQGGQGDSYTYTINGADSKEVALSELSPDVVDVYFYYTRSRPQDWTYDIQYVLRFTDIDGVTTIDVPWRTIEDQPATALYQSVKFSDPNREPDQQVTVPDGFRITSPEVVHVDPDHPTAQFILEPDTVGLSIVVPGEDSNKYTGQAHTTSLSDELRAPDDSGVSIAESFDYGEGITPINAGSYNVNAALTASYQGQTVTFWALNGGTMVIAPRYVEIRSASGTWDYDGTEHRADQAEVVTAACDGFVGDEGVESYEFTSYRLTPGTSQNEFNYTLKQNTNASNYIISKIYGSLTVVANCGTNLSYVLNKTNDDPDDDYVLDIIAENLENPAEDDYRMSDYEHDQAPWFNCNNVNYRDKITSLSLDNRIVHIGSNAFEGIERITSVTLPKDIASLGEDAFKNCANLVTLYNENNEPYTKDQIVALCPNNEEGTLPDDERLARVFSGTQLFISLTGDNGSSNQSGNEGSGNQGGNEGSSNGQQSGSSVGEPQATTMSVDSPRSASVTSDAQSTVIITEGSTEDDADEVTEDGVEKGEDEVTEKTVDEIVEESEPNADKPATDPDLVIQGALNENLSYALIKNQVPAIFRDEQGNEIQQEQGYTLKITARDAAEDEDPAQIKYRIGDYNYDSAKGEIHKVPWASYTGEDVTGETEYTDYDFRPYITSVVLDDRITDIGDYALAGLVSMKHIVLPQSIERLGANAFADGGKYGIKTVWPYRPDGIRDEDYHPYTNAQLAQLSRADLVDPDADEQVRITQQELATNLSEEEALKRVFRNTRLLSAAYPEAGISATVQAPVTADSMVSVEPATNDQPEVTVEVEQQ